MGRAGRTQLGEQLASDVGELMMYWPALASALDRDQGSASGGPTAGGAVVLSAPVNLDVLRASTVLAGEVPATAAWCCGVVGEQHTVRDVAGELPHFPRWHQRMLAINAGREAARLVQTVHTWRNMAKAAIGLLIGDRPLGELCPLHDEPRVELVAPGEEGWLTHHAGDPGPTVAWLHVDAVACPYCGARWAPRQYLFLGRLIRHAHHRRRVQVQTNRQPAA